MTQTQPRVQHLTLTIETLSPLHIGSGDVLIDNFDFIGHGGTTYVLDQEKFFREFAYEGEFSGRPDQYLKGSPLDQLDIWRYTMRGEPDSVELRPFIKTGGDPYLPGSSLKGMLRTAFLWGVYTIRQTTPDLNRLGRSRAWAAQALERDMMGRNPNYDLFRAVQVSDSTTVDADSLRVQSVSIYPTGRDGGGGIITDVEAIPKGTIFTSRIAVDEYGFQNENARLLDWEGKRQWIGYLVDFGKDFGRTRLLQERKFIKERTDIDPVRGFYAELVDVFKGLGENQFIAQIGWGAGWNSKTLNNLLLEQEQAFAPVVRQFRLKGRYSEKHQPGYTFPKSRKYTRIQERPARPMGWVKITVE